MTDRLSAWLARGRNGLILALVAFYALVALNWTGFLGSDDVTYAVGAYGWLNDFPYVGGHGTIRYTITIPMALCFLLFGESEFAMALPSLLYLTGFFVMTWSAVRRVAGALPAFWALATLVASPLLIIQASIANVDMIELFFLMASVLLFWRCIDEGPSASRLIGAGAMAGLAFLTRETAVFIAVFYALFFLAGHRFSRLTYLWIGVGFFAVWCAELVYLGIMTGDPFYRMNISAHHDSTIDRTIDVAGNVIAHPVIDPLLVLLLNQEFMLLFYFAVPAIGWLLLDKRHEARLRHFAGVLGLFGMVWLICVGAAQKLLPLNPRYFMVCAAVASILVGIAFARMLAGTQRQRILAGLGILALFGTNFAGFYVENKQSLFAERQLAALMRAQPGLVVTTDPMTRYRADLLLRWEKAGDRVLSSPPKSGSVYFYNPANAQTASFKLPQDTIPLFQPRADWPVVWRAEPEPSWLALTLERTGLSRRLPGGLWRKLRYHHPGVVQYRVP